MKPLSIVAIVAACGWFLPAVPLAAQAQAPARRVLSLDDVHAFVQVGEPQISPDGQWVAYAVQSCDAKKDKRVSHLWMVSWDGARKIQLTSGSESAHHPRFSPDGRYLSFLSSRDTENHVEQLWLMERAGGEAQRVTDVEGSITDYDWAPDGKRVVLAVRDPDPHAKTPKDKDKDKATPPIVIDRFSFKFDGLGYLDARRQHLYVFDLADKKTFCLTPGIHNEHHPVWSPDGKMIAFSSKRGDDFDRHNNYDVYLIEPRVGATPRQLTTFKGADAEPGSRGRVAWSPDGKQIAYLQSGPDEAIFYSVYQLAVIPVAGGEPRLLTTKLDRNAGRPHFSADGKSIFFSLEDDGNRHMAKIAAGGGEVERVLSGRRNVMAIDLGPGGKIAVLSGTPEAPNDIFALEASAPAEKPLRPLSRQNDALVDRLKLGTVDEIRFSSRDGTEIHGFAVKPPDFRPGTKYPTILSIHGGPVGQFANELSYTWQLFAAHGYLVVGVNPRGSSGRGEALSKAIFADWGNLDRDDVLAAVDHVVSQGLADPNRLGVGGWSYGGILTNYVIASDRRFKAAISGSSASNMLATYGTDMYTREYEAELGPPWKNPEAWLKLSYPFLHADRIKTPTLFLCGDQDFNVPLLNTEQMYQALRSLNVDTRLVIYPGQHHDIARPSYQTDRLQRYLDWYAKYLK